MTARLFVFDDARARAWAPFAPTRPVGTMLHGCFLQRERWERVSGARSAGYLAGDALAGFREDGGPPSLDVPPDRPAGAVARGMDDDGGDGNGGPGDEGAGPVLVVSSRAVPTRLARREDFDAPATLVMAGEVVGWVVPPEAAFPDRDALLDPSAAPEMGEVVEIEGSVLGWPWDLVRTNSARIVDDVSHLHEHGGAFLLTDVHMIGDKPISLGKGVQVEPGVVVDVREGAVRLESGVRVHSPARLTGPLWIGRDSRILGGSVGHSSIGPVCKVRGEVDSSVLLGYSNKAHDGYLGHAYLGRWVNLGASTVNSDLKNSYSAVRVAVSPERTVETGLLKVGCFLGDHVKTAIGTLLNTGTVVGAGSNVFGSGMPPSWIPPFSWGGGGGLSTYRLDKFLEVAATVMGRRDVELDEGTRGLLTRAWEATREQRAAAAGDGAGGGDAAGGWAGR